MAGQAVGGSQRPASGTCKSATLLQVQKKPKAVDGLFKSGGTRISLTMKIRKGRKIQDNKIVEPPAVAFSYGKANEKHERHEYVYH